MKRIIVCGSRDWKDRELIRDFLTRLTPSTIIIHGACRGADIIAQEEAEKLGLTNVPYHAKWHLYGDNAGPIRNQKMIDEGQPTLVVAFHENIKKSKGTKDMIKRAKKHGIPNYIIKR